MTSRERLLKVISGQIPDCVPVAPDTSNMIPARLTGKPFWDLYLYNDPPIWKAYIDCVKHFGFDSLMDGYVEICIEDDGKILGNNDYIDTSWIEVIVFRNDEKIITQRYREHKENKEWSNKVCVYYKSNPPARGIDPKSIGLPAIPERYEEIEGKKEYPIGEDLLKLVKEEMGENGLVGVFCGASKLLNNEEDIYDFYDNPEKYYKLSEDRLSFYEKRFEKLMSFETRPDFICTGGSGTLIHQTPEIFRELALPIVKKMTSLGKKYGIPTHIHSCGPEKELVKMVYDETDLTIIDPLEVPPMGNCILRELKEMYGDKLILKGNLNTITVMLNGSVKDVIEASKRAIDDASKGGRFILSTGDQCGRDTPDENIFAMIETARTYGRY